jgi:uncharacterized protein (UPF0332 family)
MISPAFNEHAFSDQLTKEFVGHGYQRVDPKAVRNEPPSGYTPDLIFRRGDEVIVVELKSASVHRPLEHLRYVKEAVEKRPNWQFKLYVIPPLQAEQQLRENIQDADKLLKRAERLNRNEEFEAASVLVWMAIETALRTLLTNRQSRPNPGVSGMSMARSLMSLGELSAEEIRIINQAAEMRNTSVHGYRLEPRAPLSSEIFSLARNLAKKAQSEAALAT